MTIDKIPVLQVYEGVSSVFSCVLVDENLSPIDPDSPIAPWSRAYLHHLIKSGEMLGAMLLTEHNVSFYQQLMQGMRDAIAEGRFAAFAADFRRDYLGSRSAIT